MSNITQTIENALYNYDPNEFMPVTVDGEIANWNAFALYKAKRVANHLGEFASQSVDFTINVARGFTECAFE